MEASPPRDVKSKYFIYRKCVQGSDLAKSIHKDLVDRKLCSKTHYTNENRHFRKRVEKCSLLETDRFNSRRLLEWWQLLE